MKKIQNSENRGFTLIEVLIYAVLLVIAGTIVTAIFIQIVGVTETSRRSREALDNARRSLDVITQEIRHAKGVYSPTSIIGINPGQLSLETTRDLPSADEDTTYVDIYVDNERLYLKREGQNEQIITSEKVKVTNLVFTPRNDSGDSRPTVEVSVTVEYDAPVTGTGGANAVSLVSTASLRSYGD